MMKYVRNELITSINAMCMQELMVTSRDVMCTGHIGDVCVEEIDCTSLMNNSHCYAGHCNCVTGYFPNQASTQCIPSTYFLCIYMYLN